MLKTIIIDDEVTARDALQAEIKQHCPLLEIVGEFNGVLSGKEAIDSLKPDLVFLDIQLWDGTGFQLLEKISYKKFNLIFTTAYNEYAIKAFKVNAVDYLLKPIDSEELVAAVEKSLAIQDADSALKNINKLISDSNTILHKKIAIPLTGGISVLDAADIIRIEAISNYSRIYTKQNENLLSAKTLKDFELSLQQYGFERVHHSHIINLTHLKKYSNKDGSLLEMSDGSAVPLAQRKKAFILSILDHISV
jgi:two-component system LytT family response regulator